MQKVELSYSLSRRRGSGASGQQLLRNPLLDVLHEVHERGSISAAARQLGLSYRHVWGQLKEWEIDLGQSLIVWERGQAARLTPFGQRLLMAERLAQARLGPQIESLRAELERAFATAFEAPDAPRSSDLLTLYASHDHALSALQAHALSAHVHAPANSRLHLDIRFCGSVDAIRALNEGRCEVAGFHTQPFASAGSLSARTYRPLLKIGLHKIIGFARRSQGLIVPPGNPLGLTSMANLASSHARFVNRARGTGTRLLLEEMLAQAGLSPDEVIGYDRVESSHGAVAHAVASGSADVGLGTEYAALAHGMGFVPLVQERYLLVCLKSALDTPAVQNLLRVLRSSAWQNQLAALPGYAPDHCGEVAAMKRLLPWWS